MHVDCLWILSSVSPKETIESAFGVKISELNVKGKIGLGQSAFIKSIYTQRMESSKLSM